jgi:hypothetical protein
MKSMFCLLFLFMFVPYSTVYAGERPKEFQGIYWGTHISKVEGLAVKNEPSFANLPPAILERRKEAARKSEERGEKPYLRPSDILIVPGGEVKSIEYVFVKDHFAQGIIRFDDYQQYQNFRKIYAHLYGPPDKDEKDETMTKHIWHAKVNDEADITLFFDPLINGGFLSMKGKAFLQKEAGLILGDDSQIKTGGMVWQLFREDDKGKWFYDPDGVTQPDKDILKIRVKCNLSIKRQNEWRTALKSKIMPTYAVSIEEIKCSSKETRNLQLEILSEKGPLKFIQRSTSWERISPDSMAEALHDTVCK